RHSGGAATASATTTNCLIRTLAPFLVPFLALPLRRTVPRVAVMRVVAVSVGGVSIIEHQAMQFGFIDEGDGIEQGLAGSPAGSSDEEELSRKLLERARLARGEKRRCIEQHQAARMARQAGGDLAHAGAGDELRRSLRDLS